MKGAIVHGVLLVAMLAFAYQTWTRDTTPKPTTGSVVVWNEKLGDLEAVIYETKDKTIRLDRREGYFWGSEAKTTKKPKPKKPPEPAPAPDPASPDGAAKPDGAAEPDDKAAAPATPPEPAKPEEPEFEVVTNTREFPAGEDVDLLIPQLASMRALRELGPLTEEQKAEYKIVDKDKPDEPRPTMSVVFGGKTRTLVIGDKALGGKDRYVLDLDSGKGYLIAGSLVTPLEGGENALKPKQVIPVGDDVGAIAITAGDKSKTVSRITVTDENGKQVKTWGDATSNEADQTTANFLTKIETSLKPQQYEPGTDVASLTKLVEVAYRDAKGGALGALTLYKREKPADPPPPPAEGQPAPPPPAPVVEYLIVTTRTRVPATVSKAAGDQVEQNIQTVFE